MARLLFSLVLLSLVALQVPQAVAAVSIGGPWQVVMEQDLGGPPGPDTKVPCHWDVVQADATLTASYLCPPLAGGTYAGTIDPDAGTFEISEPSPFCSGGIAVLHGTIEADSSSFTANTTCVPFGEITFTASRCQNGAVDAGEACDEGIDRLDDCCQPTCRLRTAGSECGSDGDENSCTAPQCDGLSAACPATTSDLSAGHPCGQHSGCVYDACDGAGGCTTTRTVEDGHPCGGQCVVGGGTCTAGACSAPLLPAGTSCEADLDPCTVDACDASGVCTVGSCSACCDSSGGGCAPAYDASCEHPVQGRSRVLLDGKRGGIAWSWAKGDESDFGTPEASGAAVCMYSGSDRQLIAIAEASSGSCGTEPCWKRLGSGDDRLRYKGAPGDRLRAARLREGAAGKASIAVKATGVPFLDWQDLSSLELSLPLRVQLKVANRCWESTFATGRRNTLWLFNATGGSPSGAFVDGLASGF